MAIFYAIIQEERQNCGRNSDLTYHDVLDRVSSHGAADWATFIAQNPPPPGLHYMQITEAEFHDFRSGEPGTLTTYLDGHGNLPNWAVDRTHVDFPTPGSLWGSYANPEDRLTAWTRNIPYSDPRWRVRIYANTQRTLHIASEDISEDGPGVHPTTGLLTRYLSLFNVNDTPANVNATQTAVVGGHNMIFDFTAGESEFFLQVKEGDGVITFPSNGRYRIVGPNDEKEVTWNIFTRTLRVGR